MSGPRLLGIKQFHYFMDVRLLERPTLWKRAMGFTLPETVFRTIPHLAKTDEPFDLTPECKVDSTETEDVVLRVRCRIATTAYWGGPDWLIGMVRCHDANLARLIHHEVQCSNLAIARRAPQHPADSRYLYCAREWVQYPRRHPRPGWRLIPSRYGPWGREID